MFQWRRVDRLWFLEIPEDAAVSLSRPSFRQDGLSFFPWGDSWSS